MSDNIIISMKDRLSSDILTLARFIYKLLIFFLLLFIKDLGEAHKYLH